jgi:hypothetical protein
MVPLTSRELTNMDKLSDEALNLLFRDVRTYSAWLARPVSEDILRQLMTLRSRALQCQWQPCSFRVYSFTAGEGEVPAGIVAGQCGKNHDRPGHSAHCL